ncbi:hypothetical protein CR513_29998, partial [Mucuna pruriens]
MDKTLAATRHLISNMANKTQQFKIKGAGPSWMVNEVGAIDNLRLENQLTELTSLVRKLSVGQHQPNMAARVCGICTSMEHPTDMCPTLQETESDHIESVVHTILIGGYQYEKQSYQGWPYDSQQFGRQHYQPNPTKYKIPTITTIPTTAIAESATTRQLPIFGGPDEVVGYKKPRNLNATIQDLKSLVGQLVNIVSQLQSVGFGNLPAQTIPNPRGNTSVVSLRSGIELPQNAQRQKLRIADAEFEPKVDSSFPKPVGFVLVGPRNRPGLSLHQGSTGPTMTRVKGEKIMG